MGSFYFILKAREARLQDLRWRRDGFASSAGSAVSPEMLTQRFAQRSMGGKSA
jgi:hypothetical protein